jgi:hypothetical protein
LASIDGYSGVIREPVYPADEGTSPIIRIVLDNEGPNHIEDIGERLPVRAVVALARRIGEGEAKFCVGSAVGHRKEVPVTRNAIH